MTPTVSQNHDWRLQRKEQIECQQFTRCLVPPALSPVRPTLADRESQVRSDVSRPGPPSAHAAYLVDGRTRVRLGTQRGHRVPVISARPGDKGAGARPQG